MGARANDMSRQRAGSLSNGHHDDKGFRERLTAAAEAKKAALEKFRARPGADERAVVEPQTERKTDAAPPAAGDAQQKARDPEQNPPRKKRR